MVTRTLALFLLLAAPISASQAFSCHQDTTPEVTSSMCEEIGPYLLPDNHPLKPAMDKIFGKQRVNYSDEELKRAGFRVLFTKERSFVRVARHPTLPGHLVKAYIDSDTRVKQHTPGWMWLTRRCIGAKKVRHVIKKYNLKHFQCPKKWLYVLPSAPFQHYFSYVEAQPVILLVEDMNLVSEDDNLRAWETKITEEHLDELYLILSEAGGSSYRPSNIWLSRNGKFSFVDTEYPYRDSDFKRIRPFLSSKMRAYWDKLVHKGRKKKG